MTLDREQARSHCTGTAWAVRWNGQWFAGFGGKPGGDPITKLRPHLADALLCVSVEKARDYVYRLEKRGDPGGRIVTIVAGDF